MQDFEGIAEKLKRAEENIFNLHGEIEVFFQKSDYPVLPRQNDESHFRAVQYHKDRIIPPRFSVLAGEIVHHLRSCLDHIVWHFSELPVKNIRKLEFPVFERPPANSDGRRLFDGKIEGIANLNVRKMIERLQPYNSANPTHLPLWIIHDFDIIDKHRELVVCFGTGTAVFPKNMSAILEGFAKEHPELSPLEVAVQFKDYGILQPNISFRNFGGKELQPVIPALVDLFNYTVDTVKAFQVL
jgi:hypothetical protein